MARDEEEGVEDEECQEEGAAGSIGATLEGFTRSHFVASCVALRQIDSLLMAPMT